mgnify:CR=1 FL=1|jgi:hypothetical protein
MVITFTLVLFLCLNFVLLYLFLKTIDHRKWLALLLSAVLTPVMYFYVFYPFLNIISSYHHQKHFTSEAWKDRPDLRYEMIDQMITSKELQGITKKEAQDLFGPAEWFSWDNTLKQHDSTKWNYGLGIEPGAFNTMKTNALIEFEEGRLSDISSYKEEITYDAKDP